MVFVFQEERLINFDIIKWLLSVTMYLAAVMCTVWPLQVLSASEDSFVRVWQLSAGAVPEVSSDAHPISSTFLHTKRTSFNAFMLVWV